MHKMRKCILHILIDYTNGIKRQLLQNSYNSWREIFAESSNQAICVLVIFALNIKFLIHKTHFPFFRMLGIIVFSLKTRMRRKFPAREL